MRVQETAVSQYTYPVREERSTPVGTAHTETEQRQAHVPQSEAPAPAEQELHVAPSKATDSDIAPSIAQVVTTTSPRMVDRTRVEAFAQAFAVLLAQHGYYDEATQTYQLPQLYERLRQQNGRGIRMAALWAYLNGEALPSEAKARLIADALGAPRALLLYVAGYLTASDLAHYPGPHLTLATVEADIAELADLPLSPETRARIAHDLRASARILSLLAGADDADPEANGGAGAQYVAAPDERETLIERLTELRMQADA